MQAAPPPFGEVLGAVGYHYEQWAQLSAYAQGIGVRTRDNPDFTMLDDEQLRADVERRGAHHEVDVRRERPQLPRRDAARGAAPDLVRLSAETGRRKWCATLEGRGVQGDDPFATQILPDEGVAVLGPGEGDEERLVRLSGEDGEQVWARNLDADSGDFLGDMGDETLLAGRARAVPAVRPGVAREPSGGTCAGAGLGRRTATTIWTKRAPAGSDVHVLGTDPETRTAFVQETDAGGQTRLTALDEKGDEVWSRTPARETTFDATLLSGRILVRAGNRWSAYDAEDGRRLWPGSCRSGRSSCPTASSWTASRCSTPTTR